jgi:hypothetical protein
VERFLAQHQANILGVLAGFDRVRFRGSLPSICNRRSLLSFLNFYKIRWEEFPKLAQDLTNELGAHVERYAEQHHRPYYYLDRRKIDKEAEARKIMEKDGITSGLIVVFGTVQKCKSYRLVGKNRKKIVTSWRQCKHFYVYYQHPEFGLLQVRLQTWLPFGITISINGRSFLAQQLDKAGITYTKKGNGFTDVADFPRAQAVLDQLTHFAWAPFLTELVKPLAPYLDQRYGLDVHGYYRTMDQSEYATDLLFRDAASLQAVYQQLTAYALARLRAPDVLRFLGRTNLVCGKEVATDVRRRPEGVCVKHRAGLNSVKMYDKLRSILRIEITMNDVRQFRVRRLVWRRKKQVSANVSLRKGVVDVPDRVRISRQINARYLDLLAEVQAPRPVAATLDPVSRPVQEDGRCYRALQLLNAQQNAVFARMLEGRFAIEGFRNADVASVLGAKPRNRAERRRRSVQASRHLKLLRVHGLIKKVPRSHRYRLTEQGLQVLPLAVRLRQLDLAAAA